ncbi:MAG: EamA family transporter, partial [Actinomycetota bacterium]
MSPRLSGYLLVCGGSALFASTGVVSAVAFEGGVAPIELAALRSYIAALILLPFVLLVARRIRRADLLPIVLFALIGIVLVAFSLRSAVASLSPVLDHVAADFPVSPVVVGLIGAAPPVCFAL